MKKRILGLFLASTLMLFFTGCATYSHSAAWEYKAIDCYCQNVGKTIDDMRQQGWCFVSMSAGGGGPTNAPEAVLLFKRHK
jgi:hypothetical protein